MSSKPEQIIKLGAYLAAHECVTHWAISTRICGKGDFLSKLMKGGDLKTRTADRAFQWFSDHWPADLEWPSDVPRPSPTHKVRT